MFTTREQIRIADQSIAAASRAVPPDLPQEDMRQQMAKQDTRDVQEQQQQQQRRPCTRSQQEGQRRQQ